MTNTPCVTGHLVDPKGYGGSFESVRCDVVQPKTMNKNITSMAVEACQSVLKSFGLHHMQILTKDQLTTIILKRVSQVSYERNNARRELKECQKLLEHTQRELKALSEDYEKLAGEKAELVEELADESRPNWMQRAQPKTEVVSEDKPVDPTPEDELTLSKAQQIHKARMDTQNSWKAHFKRDIPEKERVKMMAWWAGINQKVNMDQCLMDHPSQYYNAYIAHILTIAHARYNLAGCYNLVDVIHDNPFESYVRSQEAQSDVKVSALEFNETDEELVARLENERLDAYADQREDW